MTIRKCCVSLHRFRGRTRDCLWGLAVALAPKKVNGTCSGMVVKLGGSVPRGALPIFVFEHFVNTLILYYYGKKSI